MSKSSVAIIREAVADDLKAIDELLREAFPSHDEAELVTELIEANFASRVQVAEVDSRVVGVIVFSDMTIDCPDRNVQAQALAPVAVSPEFQNRGIGHRLIEAGLQACRDAGEQIVIVLGHPEYYTRFGFSSELARPIDSPFSGDVWMALELTENALSGISGRAIYAPPFGIE